MAYELSPVEIEGSGRMKNFIRLSSIFMKIRNIIFINIKLDIN